MTTNATEYIRQKGLPLQPIFTGEDTSTVPKAAAVLGVEDGQIAKTLAIRLPDGVGVLVAMGTARIDNRKFKDTFCIKAKMLSAEETLQATGFAVGGVSPFGLPGDIQIFLDESLKKYAFVYPAVGTPDSAVKVPVAQFGQFTGGHWVDVCKEPAQTTPT